MENLSQNPEAQSVVKPIKKKKFSIRRVLFTLLGIFVLLILLPVVLSLFNFFADGEIEVNAKKCSAGKCQYCDVDMCQQQADSCKVVWVPFACGSACDSYKEQCIDKSIDY